MFLNSLVSNKFSNGSLVSMIGCSLFSACYMSYSLPFDNVLTVSLIPSIISVLKDFSEYDDEEFGIYVDEEKDNGASVQALGVLCNNLLAMWLHSTFNMPSFVAYLLATSISCGGAENVVNFFGLANERPQHQLQPGYFFCVG